MDQVIDQTITSTDVRKIASKIELQMLLIVTKTDPEIAAQYKVQIEEIRRELGIGSKSAALESLLIDRLILCWIRLQFVEQQAAYSLMGRVEAAVALHWDKRLSHAQDRFLKASAALARLRKSLPRGKPSEEHFDNLLQGEFKYLKPPG